MARRYLSHQEKTRRLIGMCGSLRATVDFMKAGSKSSLRRWLRDECDPIRANLWRVNDHYQMAQKMHALERNLRRDAEMKVRMERLKQSLAGRKGLANLDLTGVDEGAIVRALRQLVKNSKKRNQVRSSNRRK